VPLPPRTSQQQQQQQQSPSVEDAPSEDPRAKEIEKLIEQLTSPDTPIRRKARSDLALYQQAAVKPMLAKLRGTFPNENAAYTTRLGVATALSRMVQPITLDAEQATQVAALIGAPDADTRIATADFLMNLESSSTIQNVYDAIAVLLKERKGPSESGNLVKNAAGILGTWARVLSDDIKSPVGTPMKEFAAQTVGKLKDELERTDAKNWAGTISTINELLQRASTASRTTNRQ
jgi:hypothetical protein